MNHVCPQEGKTLKAKAKACSNDSSIRQYYYLLAGLKFFRAAEVRVRIRSRVLLWLKFGFIWNGNGYIYPEMLT